MLGMNNGQVDPKCFRSHFGGTMYVWDSKNRTKMICPECAKYLQEQVKNGAPIEQRVGTSANSQIIKENVYDYLRIPEKARHYTYSLENVLLKLRQPNNNYVQDSLKAVEDELKEIMRYTINGKVYPHNTMFNLGMCWEADEWYYVYPLLLRGYEAGLKVAPYITEWELRQYWMASNTAPIDPMHKWGEAYSDYLKADLCVITLDTNDIDVIKLLADNRHRAGKGTIVFVRTISKELSHLVDSYDNVDVTASASFKWVCLHQGKKTYKIVISQEVGSGFKTKNEYYDYVDRLNEQVRVEKLPSTNKSMDYLIWAGANNPDGYRETNKVKQVRKWIENGSNIKILSPDEFIEIVKGGS